MMMMIDLMMMNVMVGGMMMVNVMVGGMMMMNVMAGLVWSEVKQLWDQGLKCYINDMWNILDFITNSLYIATYTLKMVAYLKVGYCFVLF